VRTKWRMRGGRDGWGWVVGWGWLDRQRDRDQRVKGLKLGAAEEIARDVQDPTGP
jgi:hypothetical protein